MVGHIADAPVENPEEPVLSPSAQEERGREWRCWIGPISKNSKAERSAIILTLPVPFLSHFFVIKVIDLFKTDADKVIKNVRVKDSYMRVSLYLSSLCVCVSVCPLPSSLGV